jgi:Bestrophin, RFP-TM, chloride channel
MAHIEFDMGARQPPAQDGLQGPIVQTDVELPEASSFGMAFLHFLTKSDSIPYKTVCAACLWSTLVVTMSYLESRWHNSGRAGHCDWWCSRVSVDPSASTYAGFPLFLLLGFRVNEAYSRYMDAANIWHVDLKLNTVQFLTHVGTAFRPGLFHENDRERIFALVAAFVETLKRMLRDERDLGEVQYMLSTTDAEDILSADDMPDYCLSLLNGYVLQAAAKPFSEVPVPGPWFPMVMGFLQNLARGKGTFCIVPLLPYFSRRYSVDYQYHPSLLQRR